MLIIVHPLYCTFYCKFYSFDYLYFHYGYWIVIGSTEKIIKLQKKWYSKRVHHPCMSLTRISIWYQGTKDASFRCILWIICISIKNEHTKNVLVESVVSHNSRFLDGSQSIIIYSVVFGRRNGPWRSIIGQNKMFWCRNDALSSIRL